MNYLAGYAYAWVPQHDFTAEELLEIAGVDYETKNITAADLQTVAVALLQQVLVRTYEEEVTVPGQPGSPQAWGFGFLAVTIACAASIIGLTLVPVLSKPIVMGGMIALGSGVLAGDAILHLIPFALGMHVHGAGNHLDIFGTAD